LKCFVLSWNTRLLDIDIVAWLFTDNYVFSCYFICKSTISFLIQSVWFAVAAAAIYFASIVDWAMIFYFFKHHERTPKPKH
jgi:hypothetical protein